MVKLKQQIVASERQVNWYSQKADDALGEMVTVVNIIAQIRKRMARCGMLSEFRPARRRCLHAFDCLCVHDCLCLCMCVHVHAHSCTHYCLVCRYFGANSPVLRSVQSC